MRFLKVLVLALTLVLGQGLAGENRASANFSVPDTRIGAQTAYNQLSYQENFASETESCVGYACFGQVTNTKVGNLIAAQEKANPHDPNWAENGTYALILHGLIGVAQGAIAGDGSAGAMAAGGGVVAGSGALARDDASVDASGASTAAYSTTYNYLNHANIEKINANFSQASCSQRGGDSACVQQAKDYASKANMAND